MRLKLSLACPEGAVFTYNYNHFLVAALDAALQRAHRVRPPQPRDLGLFTFSQLYFDQYSISREGICCHGGAVYWYISSPRIFFLESIVKGFKAMGDVSLGDQKMSVDDLEVIADPDIDSAVEFSCMSPITLSGVNNRGAPRFGRIEDHNFAELLRQDLVNKYLQIFNVLPLNDDLEIQFNQRYMEKRKRVSRLVDYDGTKVLGYMVPFSVRGNPELIMAGYQLGFGHRNNCGFGMVRIWHRPDQQDTAYENTKVSRVG